MLDQRQEDVLGPPRAPHRDADRHADDGGEREIRPSRRRQRVEHVMRQDAGGGQPDEGRGDLFERRKQLARKHPEMRDDLPDQPDHQNGKRCARTIAPAAFARDGVAARRRRRDRDVGAGVGQAARRISRACGCASHDARRSHSEARHDGAANAQRCGASDAMDLPMGTLLPRRLRRMQPADRSCAAGMRREQALHADLAQSLHGGHARGRRRGRLAARYVRTCRCPGCSARCSPPWRCRLPGAPVRLIPWGRPAGTHRGRCLDRPAVHRRRGLPSW